jgi:ribosome-associated translation inhibitor RaiA/cold shock CspA family protein
MDIPLEIAWHNTGKSEALESKIRARVDKLHRYFNHINSCRVVVDVPHRSPNSAKRFHVRIEVRVPDREIVVSRDPGDNEDHYDPDIAIRDAFDAMDRRLESHSQQVRGQVKTLDRPPQGRVRGLFDTYGFIEMLDGQEIFFSHTAVVDGRFEDLEAGAPVELTISTLEGPEGPQASMVRQISDLQMEDEPPGIA